MLVLAPSLPHTGTAAPQPLTELHRRTQRAGADAEAGGWQGRGGEVVELRNRQIIDTLDDDDVRDIKYKKEPEIYNENKKIKKNPNS